MVRTSLLQRDAYSQSLAVVPRRKLISSMRPGCDASLDARYVMPPSNPSSHWAFEHPNSHSHIHYRYLLPPLENLDYPILKQANHSNCTISPKDKPLREHEPSPEEVSQLLKLLRAILGMALVMAQPSQVLPIPRATSTLVASRHRAPPEPEERIFEVWWRCLHGHEYRLSLQCTVGGKYKLGLALLPEGGLLESDLCSGSLRERREETIFGKTVAPA